MRNPKTACLFALLMALSGAIACDDEKESSGSGAAPEQSASEPTPVKAGASTGERPGHAHAGRGRGAGDGSGGGRWRDEHRRRQRRFPFPVLYVDGQPRGVVRFGELPPGLRSTWVELDVADKRKVRRFVLAEYLEALGIELGGVRAVHLYGGRGRVGLVGEQLLERHRKDLMFSFTRGDAGRLRMEWPAGIDINDTVDKVQAIAVYVAKPPPTYDEEERRLELGGKPVEGVPYAEETMLRGTRVYLDGRLVATLEPEYGRRAKARAGELAPRPLLEALRARGIGLDGVGTLDLVDADRLVERVPLASLAEANFRSVIGSRHRVEVLPSGKEATALLLYRDAEPPDRASAP